MFIHCQKSEIVKIIQNHHKIIINIWILCQHSIHSFNQIQWEFDISTPAFSSVVASCSSSGAAHCTKRCAQQRNNCGALRNPFAAMLCIHSTLFHVHSMSFHSTSLISLLHLQLTCSQSLRCNTSTSPQDSRTHASSKHPELFLQQAVSFRALVFGLIIDLNDVRTAPEPTNQQD